MIKMQKFLMILFLSLFQSNKEKSACKLKLSFGLAELQLNFFKFYREITTEGILRIMNRKGTFDTLYINLKNEKKVNEKGDKLILRNENLSFQFSEI